MKNILVTGGAGYIGSHMVLLLLENGYNPVVIDNLSTSSLNNLNKIEEITNKKFTFINHDIKTSLDSLNIDVQIDGIIHFAAFKDVGESMKDPLKYYENNVYGTVNVLKWAQKNGVKKFIFSSTSATYGNATESPVKETTPTIPLSPYGRSKLYMENVIKDYAFANESSAVILRYFNVAGNHESGLIGDPQKNPGAFIPAMICTHLGYKLGKMQIFGNDYSETRDGTCVRDFIHVMDLVDAHMKALEYLEDKTGTYTFNLGTKNGITLMEAINAFEAASGEKLNYEIGPRREGDIVISIADPSLAKQELGWEPQRGVKEIMESAWKWYKENYNR